MRIESNRNRIPVILLAVLLTSFSSCLTSKKMDSFVAKEYNDELPKPEKKKRTDVVVVSPLMTNDKAISKTVQKTNKLLPLVLYWQFDFRRTCTLNPAIPVSNFTNTLNLSSNKALTQKLNGQRLELTVEQLPTSFALVDKGHMIWLIYPIGWEKLYIEPDFKDLVVSYKLYQGDSQTKNGKISIKNSSQNQGIRFFQSWKSATSEYLNNYNAELTAMSKAFVKKLLEEI